MSEARSSNIEVVGHIELFICMIRLVKILELIYSNSEGGPSCQFLSIYSAKRKRKKLGESCSPCNLYAHLFIKGVYRWIKQQTLLWKDAQFEHKQLSLFIRTDAFRLFPTGRSCQPVFRNIKSPRLISNVSNALLTKKVDYHDYIKYLST